VCVCARAIACVCVLIHHPPPFPVSFIARRQEPHLQRTSGASGKYLKYKVKRYTHLSCKACYIRVDVMLSVLIHRRPSYIHVLPRSLSLSLSLSISLTNCLRCTNGRTHRHTEIHTCAHTLSDRNTDRVDSRERPTSSTENRFLPTFTSFGFLVATPRERRGYRCLDEWETMINRTGWLTKPDRFQIIIIIICLYMCVCVCAWHQTHVH